jgi:myosin heavy subunit
MLAGATAAERKKWHLKDKTQYHYLDQSSVLELEGVDEKDEFLLLTSSMQSVGIGRYSSLYLPLLLSRRGTVWSRT